MYAVVKTGGKQYRVQEGDVLFVEKLDAEVDSTVELNEVLDQKNKEIQNLENAQNEIAANNQISQDTSSSNTLVADSSASQSTSNNINDENKQFVWVGNSGTKYHNQGCRTLKGNGHQITLEKALSEGRQPCKVCH